MNSIRLRLVTTLMLALLLAWAAVIWATWFKTTHEADEVYDAHLERVGMVLAGLVLHEMEEDRKAEADQPAAKTLAEEVSKLEKHFRAQTYAAKLEFRIWFQGRPLLHSSFSPPALIPHSDGFSTYDFNGISWRTHSRILPDEGLTVEVAERLDVRRQMIDEITTQTLLPLAIALPLIGLVVWFAVGRAMRPLRRLADEVNARAPDQLDRIGDGHATPKELMPLVAALDALPARIETMIERERRFTADAAHELRTPLANLRTQTQVAQRARDDGERNDALNGILDGIDRATHLVTQMLTLARLDPGQMPDDIDIETVELRSLAGEVIGECVPAALAGRVDLGLSDGGAVLVRGNRSGLAILMRNLIDNAVRYTPPNGRVEVAVGHDGNDALFTVADSGPGIAREDRETLFERFCRGSGHDAPGCGLGLSIVQRVVEIHGGAIRLASTETGGLLVEVRLPLNQAAG